MEDEVAEVRAIHHTPDPFEVPDIHVRGQSQYDLLVNSPAQIWGTSVYIIVIPTLRI